MNFSKYLILSSFYFIVHLFITKENQEVVSNPWERGQAVLGIYILAQRLRFYTHV